MYKELTFNLGFGIVASLKRGSDFTVTLQIADNMEQKHKDGTIRHLEVLPLAWRPSTAVYINCGLLIGSNVQPDRELDIIIYPDGSVWSYSKGNTTVPMHVIGTTSYSLSSPAIFQARIEDGGEPD